MNHIKVRLCHNTPVQTLFEGKGGDGALTLVVLLFSATCYAT
jgi:hypothetical protein